MAFPDFPGAPIDLQHPLEAAIIGCGDLSDLLDLLRKQTAVAAPSERLRGYLSQFIAHPVPHLTAEVFRVFQQTGSNDQAVQAEAAKYLTLSHYQGAWYDEVVRALGWANELIKIGTTSPLIPAYVQLTGEAEAVGEQELLDFCEGYRR